MTIPCVKRPVTRFKKRSAKSNSDEKRVCTRDFPALTFSDNTARLPTILVNVRLTSCLHGLLFFYSLASARYTLHVQYTSPTSRVYVHYLVFRISKCCTTTICKSQDPTHFDDAVPVISDVARLLTMRASMQASGRQVQVYRPQDDSRVIARRARVCLLNGKLQPEV